MQDFVFENATRFYFGHDGIAHITGELKGASTVMVAYGGGSVKRTGIFERVAEQVTAAGASIVEFGGIPSNPTLDKVMEGAALARQENVDYILAVGGGSVMDCCKTIALAAADPLPADAFWQKYFVDFAPIEGQPLPLGIIVTAWGTGSEGNGGGVITNTKTKVKTGADRPKSNARFCIQDPTLSFTVPNSQKAAGGYDIMNHLMEEYFSAPIGNVLTDELIEAAMRSVIENLPIALEKSDDYQSHANLEWASSLAENRVMKSGKQTCFQCHMLEHSVGAYTNCVHGFGLAAITANYYRRIFAKTPEALYQFDRFATNVWGIDAEGKSKEELALAGIDALQAWTERIGAYHTLEQLGCTEDMIPAIAAGVPILPTALAPITPDDVTAILMNS
ncbi:MAG: iron-containing alcohol dehydrogenase [Eggerthellaceae bacterium]|jgi:alcohol dehydrogenase YqhD (iron-dependent ADH family)